MNAWVSLNRSSWHSADSRRFFSVVSQPLQLCDLIGKSDELVGQGVEKAEVLDLLFDLPGLRGGNALGALFTLQGALQNEIGSRLDDFAVASGLKELAT